MGALATVVAGAALMLPGPGAPGPSQTRVVYDNGRPASELQAWVDASLIPSPPGVVIVHVTPCDAQTSSCTRPPGEEMWLHEDPDTVRGTFLHELGHRFDYLWMTDAARSVFRRLIHDPRPWRSPPNSPHERFAAAYEACARHRTLKRREIPIDWGFGYAPTPRVHRRVCRLIRQVAVGAATQRNTA